MFASVENAHERGPMIVGFGTREQRARLLTAGCAHVIYHPDERDLLMGRLGLSIRDGDTLVLTQPSLLKKSDYRKIREVGADQGIRFQVVGHAPVALATDSEIVEFRRRKPKGKQAPMERTTGRKPTVVEGYTAAQADAIIRAWHAKPRKKPGEVRAEAERVLGLPDGSLPKWWVRDLVIKFVKTAKRDKPAGWKGVE